MLPLIFLTLTVGAIGLFFVWFIYMLFWGVDIERDREQKEYQLKIDELKLALEHDTPYTYTFQVDERLFFKGPLFKSTIFTACFGDPYILSGKDKADKALRNLKYPGMLETRDGTLIPLSQVKNARVVPE